MQIRNLLPMIVCLVLTSATGVTADEQQDAARMKQLLADVQKVVPPGWSVEFEFVNPTNINHRGSNPSIVIKSEATLPVEFHAPSSPEGSIGDPPEISQITVWIRFIALPYMSAPNHAKSRERNETLIQRRIDFERKHLSNVRVAFKGSEHIPPYAYDPQTDRESQLIRQYAYLWISTQPQRLPTHHTDQLSFEMRYLPLDLITIHDDEKSKEYEQIVGAVQKLIVPYEPSS